jgi:hypothetical protein
MMSAAPICLFRIRLRLQFQAGFRREAQNRNSRLRYCERANSRSHTGEVLARRNMMWALTDAMAHNPDLWVGDAVLPNANAGLAYRWLMTVGYPRVIEAYRFADERLAGYDLDGWAVSDPVNSDEVSMIGKFNLQEYAAPPYGRGKSWSMNAPELSSGSRANTASLHTQP